MSVKVLDNPAKGKRQLQVDGGAPRCPLGTLLVQAGHQGLEHVRVVDVGEIQRPQSHVVEDVQDVVVAQLFGQVGQPNALGANVLLQ